MIQFHNFSTNGILDVLLILNNEQFDTFLVRMWQGIEMAMSQKLLLNPINIKIMKWPIEHRLP